MNVKKRFVQILTSMGKMQSKHNYKKSNIRITEKALKKSLNFMIFSFFFVAQTYYKFSDFSS